MRIDLKRVIEDRDLDRGQLAQALFPANLHPAAALSRLLLSRARMKEEQIYRLSIFTGLSIDALYMDALYWKTTTHDDVVRFSKDNYCAIYSPATGVTKIYHLEKEIAVHVIGFSQKPFAEYFRELDQIIINQSVSV